MTATDYLRELDAALADVPRDVRTEIVAGIREELEGLSETDASARMSELGDPLFIAAAAREDVPPRESRTLPTVAAIVVMVGGVVVPVVGWVVGIVLVWMSRLFSTRTKILVTLLPALATAVVTFGIFGLAKLNESREVDAGGFHGPSIDEFVNPLVPSYIDYLQAGMFAAPIVAFATGIFLLVKARRG